MVILRVSGSNHGTVARYNNQKCRCDSCREANRMHQSKRRAKTYLIRELEAEIKGLVAEDAASLHWAVENALEDIGFVCEREVDVPDRGDGRPGRIDLVARRGGIIVALELDRSSPRVKSIAKLRAFPCDVRLVVLRTPARGALDVPKGIDGVIGCQ